MRPPRSPKPKNSVLRKEKRSTLFRLGKATGLGGLGCVAGVEHADFKETLDQKEREDRHGKAC